MLQTYGMLGVAVILCLIAYGISVWLYKKTDYYQVTGYSYLFMRLDLGRYGEYLTYRCLRSYENKGAKFLFNCYLPRDNGDTTEIDVLMIYKSGLYVFESKNYSGWIFGNEKSKTWTQTLPQGRKSHKEHFLNPVMQNKLHIKWLRNLIQDETIPIHSVVVFSERCTLKKIDIFSQNVAVIKRNHVLETVSAIDSTETTMLTSDKVTELYQILYPYSQASMDIKQAHIDSINSRIGQRDSQTEMMGNQSDKGTNVEMISETDEQIFCPKCGAPLVLRTAKKGKNTGQNFYGCSSFPKCRYIQNIPFS